MMKFKVKHENKRSFERNFKVNSISILMKSNRLKRKKRNSKSKKESTTITKKKTLTRKEIKS